MLLNATRNCPSLPKRPHPMVSGAGQEARTIILPATALGYWSFALSRHRPMSQIGLDSL